MSQFVIVIEVDNKRAAAAYHRGVFDLELIWPQIEKYAAAADHRRSAEEARKEAEYDVARAIYLESMDAYRRSMDAWRSRPTLFRGRPPRFSVPRPPIPPSMFLSHSESGFYKSMRGELHRMANLAQAAQGPFLMTEHQVAAMIAWEDGSRIEQIKARIAQVQQP